MQMVGVGEIITRILWRLIPRPIRQHLEEKRRWILERASFVVPQSRVAVHKGQKARALPPFTLVATVLNEVQALQPWLDSILSQTINPEEFIVCDGGSVDGTKEVLETWLQANSGKIRGRVITETGANISRGRNVAISSAETEIVLLTDAGCVLDETWAERLVAPFGEEPNLDAVFGYYQADIRTPLQKAVSYFIVPRLSAINPATFLPSGRSMALKKSAWRKAETFPEYLTLAGEDSLFGYYLKTNNENFAFVPNAIARWRFPETTGEMWRMIYRYARGDAEGGTLFWAHYTWLLKQVFYLGVELVMLLLLGGVSLIVGWKVFWLVTLVFLFFPLRRIVRLCSPFCPFAELEGGFREALNRSTGLLLVILAQCAGFIRGLFSYREVQNKRIRSAETLKSNGGLQNTVSS